MKRLSMAVALSAFAATGLAQGEIFKCTAPDGKVSFTSLPCDSSSHSAVQRPGPPRIMGQGEPADLAHTLNLKATEYLKVSGRAKVTVYETERYKAFQKSHPPPPNVASQCRSPLYDSQCFDPSGGTSSKPRGSVESLADH
ncbi:DUF4124 domain-containing protein [Pseudomonas sp. CDFA 602]|uniref:DUF4124 domain-containing protein n=1 Tax=Pseudomonas californiensis TaxID=2829823 RepID=UPI001E461510|nr:DUF4124 domain-containing protein [Pseudomonas californiensis]MCD5993105.1 DUF4124 domain-containing protein [Pseudomonas californiensis]MCD5998482.1 DUF4124 domain-containing protein [Pseudomonas californiensis]